MFLDIVIVDGRAENIGTITEVEAKTSDLYGKIQVTPVT
jgi:hypothetical protein